MSQLLLAIAESPAMVGILIATNGAITTALSIVYRDCRKDRAALWSEIRELQKRR
jgi:hypothetical protein